MKLPVSFHAFAASLCVIGLSIAMFAGCGGCAAGKGQYSLTTGLYDTNALADTLVVTVESTRAIALDAMDLLMKTEFENKEALLKINPGIHASVDIIRRDGKKTLDALTESKLAFQRTRSSEDATKLKSSLAAVQSLLSSAVKYLAEIAAAKKEAP